MVNRKLLNAVLLGMILVIFCFPFSTSITVPSSLSGEDHKEGSLMIIDNSSYYEYSPAVAYSSKHKQYLVVYPKGVPNPQYEDDRDLYGRFVDASTCTPLGTPFWIAREDNVFEVAPDVAYDVENDRFVVVYEEMAQHSTESIVRAVVVYGNYQSSGSQLPFGAGYHRINSSDQAADPAISYNGNDD